MPVWTLGLNHHTAALDMRGRFAFAANELPEQLHSLGQSLGGSEVAILSTCNRTEIYAASEQPQEGTALHWLAQTGATTPEALRSHTYIWQGEQAARHAFRVASGLDSMVLGEPQILGQLKDAVRAAEDAGTMGATLHQLFQRSFAVAKQVRTHTAIGEHSISMAAASVNLAAQLFEDLAQVHVLLIGAGEMIELVATHFAAKNPLSIALANRTLERGEQLAGRIGAQLMRLGDVPERLHAFDVVISCTASTLPLIGLGAVEQALKQRRHRPIFMVDLAVPRDIEPQVKALDDVYLYTVDDLAQVVQTGKANRQAAVAQAEVIVDAGVHNFMHWLSQRHTVPLIQQLKAQTDAWSAQEVARAKKKLAQGEPVDEVLEVLANRLTQKLLHGTLAELHVGDAHSRQATADAVSRLFLRGKIES